MTRLIDADAMIKDIHDFWDWKTVEGITATTVLKQTITDVRNAPTVEAIPIEYIKNQIGRWERSKCQSYHAICYRHLIEEWEMENDRLDS